MRLMDSAISLETNRLILRQWHDSDYDVFAQMNADKQVMQFYPSRLSRQESSSFARRLRNKIALNGWGFWALELKMESRFIGFLGLNKPDYNLPFQPCIEIGWRLARNAWGFGYATEAARAALRYGFKELQLDEIVSFCVTANTRSYALMQRLGMSRQKQTFRHPLIAFNDPLSEHYLYKLSKHDWLANLKHK